MGLHVVEISIISALFHVIVRLTKIFNNLCKASMYIHREHSVTPLEYLSLAEFRHAKILGLWFFLVLKVKNWAHFWKTKYVHTLKIKVRKIPSIFDAEKWLWKSESTHFWSSNPKRTKSLEFCYTHQIGAQLFKWVNAKIVFMYRLYRGCWKSW